MPAQSRRFNAQQWQPSTDPAISRSGPVLAPWRGSFFMLAQSRREDGPIAFCLPLPACLSLPVCFQERARPSRPKRRPSWGKRWGKCPVCDSILRSTRIEVSPNNPRAVRNDMACRRRQQWMARMSQESGQTPWGKLVWEHRQSPGEGWCIMCVTGQGSMSSRGSNLAGSRDRLAMKSLMALLACFVSTPPPITALVGRPSNVDRPSSCYTSQRPLRPCRWSQSAMDHTCSRRHWGDTDDGGRCHHLPQISPSPSPDPSPRFSSIQPHHRRTAAGSLV